MCKYHINSRNININLVCAASLHNSMSLRCERASKRVCATFIGLLLSIIAFRKSSILFSTSNISCCTWKFNNNIYLTTVNRSSAFINIVNVKNKQTSKSYSVKVYNISCNPYFIFIIYIKAYILKQHNWWVKIVILNSYCLKFILSIHSVKCVYKQM